MTELHEGKPDLEHIKEYFDDERTPSFQQVRADMERLIAGPVDAQQLLVISSRLINLADSLIRCAHNQRNP